MTTSPAAFPSRAFRCSSAKPFPIPPRPPLAPPTSPAACFPGPPISRLTVFIGHANLQTAIQENGVPRPVREIAPATPLLLAVTPPSPSVTPIFPERRRRARRSTSPSGWETKTKQTSQTHPRLPILASCSRGSSSSGKRRTSAIQKARQKALRDSARDRKRQGEMSNSPEVSEDGERNLNPNQV